jgi:uncharacterized membrane protein YgdD (TMEM256/DUF423 family)
MERIFLFTSGVLGFLGVALGAFGAHALRDYLEKLPDGVKRAEWWETASRYHLINTVAIGLAAYVAWRAPGSMSTAAGFCFAGGVLVFSGSLYAMTLTGMRFLGAITPLGGILMMAGWVALAIAAARIPK